MEKLFFKILSDPLVLLVSLSLVLLTVLCLSIIREIIREKKKQSLLRKQLKDIIERRRLL